MKVVFPQLTPAQRGLVVLVALSNVLSITFFGLRVLGADNFRYWFMLWNLGLAWLPLLFAWLLTWLLRSRLWRQPLPLAATLLWLAFLPNSFYLISDLIHLQHTGEISVLFDAVLFVSFIANGLLAGYGSMLLVHRELAKRFDRLTTVTLIGLVLLVTSFAIYLGRTLRWNSWDIVLHPAGVLFDVSDGLINPLAHPQVVVTTGTFFVLLSVLYGILCYAIAVIRELPADRPRA